MIVWQVVESSGGRERIVAVHVDEAEAGADAAARNGAGRTADVVRTDMGGCGCGG